MVNSKIIMSEEQVNILEEQARKRQERLKSLKRKREDKSSDDKSSENKDNLTLPAPKFRSYKPQDDALKERVMQKPNTSDVRNEVKDLLDLAKSEMVIDQLDVTNLAPRQPDWDLKRDVEKKLEKLSRRTQKAMAELIREKLKAKQDLAAVPSVPGDV